MTFGRIGGSATFADRRVVHAFGNSGYSRKSTTPACAAAADCRLLWTGVQCMAKLDGKVAVITGAEQWIGLATARKFVK